MDELDRLYRRMVQNIRASFPELLTRPFEVSLVYQQIVPYRLNRRELSFDNNEEYELALMQLLSGTRGMLLGDAEMQAALRKELDSANPDLTAFRAQATAMVSLAPEALRALDAQPAVRSPSAPAGVAAVNKSATEQAALASRATENVSVSASSSPVLTVGGSARPAPLLPTKPTPMAQTIQSGCRYCGGSLPDGRGAVFCPHCGHNLTVQHCPACKTELDVEWKFCITCGREV